MKTMKPWIRWSLLAVFLGTLLVIQFIPGETGVPVGPGEGPESREDAAPEP